MDFPIEIKYLIYDYLYGTPIHNYNLVIKNIYQISYSFTSHNPKTNILLILEKHNLVNIENWNFLWYKKFYNRFFSLVYCDRMLAKKVSLQSIPRIFINFSKIKYSNMFMDIK